MEFRQKAVAYVVEQKSSMGAALREGRQAAAGITPSAWRDSFMR